MYFNAQCAVIAQKDEFYRSILNKADLVYPDGVSIVLASTLLKKRLPTRSTAADFMPLFCRRFADNGLKVYLLGAEEGVAREAGQRLKEQVPEIQIVGTHHGYFKKEETKEILSTINEARPDILLVGLGIPYQEKWIETHSQQLDVSVVWGVGGLFDFLSGRLRRGPQWLVDNGFEWLCRLAIEPRRLWKRYLFGNLQFSWMLFRDRIKGL